MSYARANAYLSLCAKVWTKLLGSTSFTLPHRSFQEHGELRERAEKQAFAVQRPGKPRVHALHYLET